MIAAKFPHIARSVKADKTVEVKGDVYIGENCRLASNAKFESCGGRLIVGDNSTFGENTIVKSGLERTILGTDLIIGNNCIIEGSIGHGTVVGDNVTISSTVKIGRNCEVASDQVLDNIELDDGKKFIEGKISN